MDMGSDEQRPGARSRDERRAAAALDRLAALHPKLIDLGRNVALGSSHSKEL